MSETRKCKCGAEIEGVIGTPPSAGKFWQRVGTCEVCVDNHWHEPAEPTRIWDAKNLRWIDEPAVPAVPAQEAPREPTCAICGVCESWHSRTGCGQWEPAKCAYNDLGRCYVCHGDHTAPAEPQAGAQVPSQD
jgi:hypothetical protein